MGQQHRALGAYGERLARRAYEAAGYQVLAQNWRCRDGEIDLVLSRGGCVVVCEVKTRSSERFGWPAEAVDWRKQARLRRLAVQFLRERELRGVDELRFDVASVLGRQVQIIERAF